MSLPKIAVTMGDPSGVGPEICLDLLQDKNINKFAIPVVIGNLKILESCSKKINRKPIFNLISNKNDCSINLPSVIDLSEEDISIEDFLPGAFNKNTGKASYLYIKRAINMTLKGKFDAIVTAPIHKEALNEAGIKYPGHTEIFSSETNSKKYCMMQFSNKLICSFVTTHIGINEISSHLSSQRIIEVIELTRNALKKLLNVKEPNMIVCGLNPHSGENGLFGNREEEKIIIPAINFCKSKGFNVEGPYPPDTAFIKRNRDVTDAYICMYHDQGHIPIKILSFDSSVNLTLGLPIIRTSVCHGTGLDIAWRGKASSKSLIEAVRVASVLSGCKF